MNFDVEIINMECFVDCNKDMSRLGLTIKMLRERIGMSQDDFSEGICERSFLSKLENGARKAPSIVMLSKMCQKLNITMDDLFLLSFGDNDEIMSVVVADINALIYSDRFDDAYEMAKTHFINTKTPIYRQLYLLTKALYCLYKNEYEKTIFIVEEAINLTTTLTGPLYTLTELRLVNIFLYINIVEFRMGDECVFKQTFDNFSYYIQHNYTQSYREIGFMYSSLCLYFLYSLELRKFKVIYDNCMAIFKENNFLEHQRIGWMHMYFYCCINGDYKEAIIYYDKIVKYCELFGNRVMNLTKKHIEHFSDRLGRDISPEAIMEVIANA